VSALGRFRVYAGPLEEIGGILGKTFVDNMLDQIFNDFCIGK